MCNYIFKIAVLVVIVIMAISCDISKQVPSEYSGQQITFGHGGGFAGIEYTYVLMDNGALFKKAMGETESEFLNKVNRNQTDQIFSNIEKLDLANYRYMRPGNLYNFIEVDGPQGVNRIAWDDQDKLIDKEIEILYGILKKGIEHAK